MLTPTQNPKRGLTVAPLLELIDNHAADADSQRNIPDAVIAALKENPIMSYTAAHTLGGVDATAVQCGLELEAVAARCSSTAWVLWNHLATFHLFAGLLGPENTSLLEGIVRRGEWVCFPAGASTAIRGQWVDTECVLEGKAAFGSGARYAEWAGASFVGADVTAPQFTMVPLKQPGVQIDHDWQAMSLRASATDTVRYNAAKVSAEHIVDFPFKYRVAFRDPHRPMVAHRYREDWVGLSDVWLGLMAAGLAQASMDEVASGIKERIAIMGVKVAQRPTVHVNLGLAQANINAARDTALQTLQETDERIAAEVIPTETDYLRQLASSMVALKLCDDALRLMQRVMGGNGLREGPGFERRWRDFQAMPQHINAHADRVSEQYGRHVLGLETENPF